MCAFVTLNRRLLTYWLPVSGLLGIVSEIQPFLEWSCKLFIATCIDSIAFSVCLYLFSHDFQSDPGMEVTATRYPVPKTINCTMVHSHTRWDGMGWDGNSMCKRLHWNTLIYQRTIILQINVRCQYSKNLKFSHTRYRTLGPELIPVYRQSAHRWLSHPPGGRLPLLSARPVVTSVVFTRWRQPYTR